MILDFHQWEVNWRDFYTALPLHISTYSHPRETQSSKSLLLTTEPVMGGSLPRLKAHWRKFCWEKREKECSHAPHFFLVSVVLELGIYFDFRKKKSLAADMKTTTSSCIQSVAHKNSDKITAYNNEMPASSRELTLYRGKYVINFIFPSFHIH